MNPALALYRDTAASLGEFRTMTLLDVEAVMAVEQSVYPFPWTAGNFRDALKAGYDCWVLEAGGELMGYGVMMVAAGEAHLLTVAVAAGWQRQGLGRRIMDFLLETARGRGADFMFLEVRPSNGPALALYERMGFSVIARRKNYYPAPGGREDAVIMSRGLA